MGNCCAADSKPQHNHDKEPYSPVKSVADSNGITIRIQEPSEPDLDNNNVKEEAVEDIVTKVEQNEVNALQSTPPTVKKQAPEPPAPVKGFFLPHISPFKPQFNVRKDVTLTVGRGMSLDEFAFNHQFERTNENCLEDPGSRRSLILDFMIDTSNFDATLDNYVPHEGADSVSELVKTRRSQTLPHAHKVHSTPSPAATNEKDTKRSAPSPPSPRQPTSTDRSAVSTPPLRTEGKTTPLPMEHKEPALHKVVVTTGVMQVSSRGDPHQAEKKEPTVLRTPVTYETPSSSPSAADDSSKIDLAAYLDSQGDAILDSLTGGDDQDYDPYTIRRPIIEDKIGEDEQFMADERDNKDDDEDTTAMFKNLFGESYVRKEFEPQPELESFLSELEASAGGIH